MSITAIGHLDDTVVIGRIVILFGQCRFFCIIVMTLRVFLCGYQPARDVPFIMTYGNGAAFISSSLIAQRRRDIAVFSMKRTILIISDLRLLDTTVSYDRLITG